MPTKQAIIVTNAIEIFPFFSVKLILITRDRLNVTRPNHCLVYAWISPRPRQSIDFGDQDPFFAPHHVTQKDLTAATCIEA